MKYNSQSRRAFLQGAGGLLVAIPFLDCLISEKALAASSPTARFVFMGSFFGRDLDYWYPAQDPTQISPDGTVRYSSLTGIQGEMSYILGSSFDPVRSKMSIIRGLDALNVDNAHQFSMPLTASGSLSAGTPTFGYSVDAILEESLKFTPATMPIGALRTTVHNEVESFPYSYSSKSGTTQPLATEWSAQTVFDNYFNPSTASARAASAQRKYQVSNSIMPDFQRLMASTAIPASDKIRVDNYLSLLTSLEARLQNSVPACGMAQTLTLGTTADTLQSAMIDLEVAALACGMTNVVVHGIRHYETTIDQDYTPLHAASHANGASMATQDSSVSQHAYYNRWILSKAAEMLTKLDAVPDSNGTTLLDNTFFLYGIPDSRGFHSFYDMGVIVAGGQGTLRLGQYMDFRPRLPDGTLNVVSSGNNLIAGRPYNNLLVTLMRGMGLAQSDYQKFGQAGFGTYSGYDPSLASWYSPYTAQPNATLPFLYTGT